MRTKIERTINNFVKYFGPFLENTEFKKNVGEGGEMSQMDGRKEKGAY